MPVGGGGYRFLKLYMFFYNLSQLNRCPEQRDAAPPRPTTKLHPPSSTWKPTPPNRKSLSAPNHATPNAALPAPTTPMKPFPRFPLWPSPLPTCRPTRLPSSPVCSATFLISAQSNCRPVPSGRCLSVSNSARRPSLHASRRCTDCGRAR